MKKMFVLLIVLLFTPLIYSQALEELFKAMPFEIVPALSSEDKDMMMISKDVVSIPTPLGEIKKVSHTDVSIILQTSKVGKTQIILLPYNNDDNVLCVIKTVCDDICDSNISFYSTEWKQLDVGEFITEVSIDSFIKVSDLTKSISSNIVLPLLYPIEANFNESSSELIMNIDFESVFGKMQFELMESYIYAHEAAFKWNGFSFSK